MADYRVADIEKLESDLTGVADEVRTLADTTSKMSLEVMKGNIAEANEKVDSQAAIISQIKTALQGKASSGGDLSEIEQMIDESGVLDSTEGSVNEKVEELIEKAEESKLPSVKWLEVDSEGYPITVDISSFSIIPYTLYNPNSSGGAYNRVKKVICNKEPITTVPKLSFTYCVHMTELILDLSQVEIFANGCFNGCRSLPFEELPETTRILETTCFKDCNFAKFTKIPKKVESIGDTAFYAGWRTSSYIIFKGTPNNIASNAFTANANIIDIYCPWAEGAVANAPWGATNATIHYNTQYDENGNPITT